MQDEDEDEEDDEDEEGFGDDKDPNAADDTRGGQAMQYKCSKCGEVNQVMPPKGTKIMKMGESSKRLARIKQENTSLRETAARLRTQLHAKESRFQSSNGKVAKLVTENVRLRAENMAHKRMTEARRMLREAEVPNDILSVSDLMALEPTMWAGEIKRAKRMIESEARLLHGGGHGGSHADGERRGVDSSAEAISAFRESYKRSATDTTGEDA